MKVAVFSTKAYDRRALDAANEGVGHELTFLEPRLTRETVSLAEGFDAVCCFVNDELDAGALIRLNSAGVKLVALRCAGFNNVDLQAADELGMVVMRVPAYSPHAVAEHTLALMLTLNRQIHRAFARVREGNLSLEGLLGFELSKCAVGVVGTGKIGLAVCRILKGVGCRILAYDKRPNDEARDLGVEYVDRDELFRQCEVVTLHCPLTPETQHMINYEALAKMKRGVMLINTSRGAIIDSRAVLDALKSGKIGYLGLDVYEEEADLFYEDLSNHVIQDDVFARLLTFPNVVVTSHQAFFTRDALETIARTTVENISRFDRGETDHENRVRAEKVKPAG